MSKPKPSTWIKTDTSVGKFYDAKMSGGDFDRAPREYRSPPASDLQRNLPRKEWTRVEPSGPLYPELPPFLWGVASGLVLAVPIVGLVGVLG